MSSFGHWDAPRQNFDKKSDTLHIFAPFDTIYHFFHHYSQKCKMIFREVENPKLNSSLFSTLERFTPNLKTFLQKD